MFNKLKLMIPLLVIVNLTINPVYAWQLKPFETTYTATISNIPFDGQATYKLTKKAATWHFQTIASMAIAERRESTNFTLANNIIKPIDYEFRQIGLKTSLVTLNFDWKKSFAKGHIKDKKHDDDIFFDLKYKMLDQLSTQLALQIDIARGKKHMSYDVIEGDKIDLYKFNVIGDEVIDTPIGKIKTVKVERVRDDKHSKRKTFIWFAKDWNYTVVRLYHLEKNGQEYVISLAQGAVDGKTIKGD